MAWFAKYDGVDGSPMADGLSNTFSFGERPIFVPETGDEVLVGFEFGDVSHDVDGRDFLIWQRGGSPSPNDTFVFISQSSNGGAANNVNLGAAGIVTLGGDTTFGGTVTLADDSRIQVLDDGLLLPAVSGNNTYGGLVTMDSSASDTVNNGGDIILTGFGTLG